MEGWKKKPTVARARVAPTLVQADEGRRGGGGGPRVNEGVEAGATTESRR